MVLTSLTASRRHLRCMDKFVAMKQSLAAVILLTGFLGIARSYTTTGSYVKQLSNSKEIKTDHSQMEKFKFLHLFTLNHSSEYLVKNQDKNEFAMYKSDDTLPPDKSGLIVWQKLGLQGNVLNAISYHQR